MAFTRISDLITPAVFAAYMSEEVTIKSRFISSPIVQTAPEYNALVSGGGNVFEFPSFAPIDFNSGQVPTDFSSLATSKITAQLVKTPRLIRAESWQVRNLASMLAGTDANQAIAQYTGDYWRYVNQSMLLSILKGIFTTALSSSHVLDATTDLSAAGDYAGSTAASQELARLNAGNTIDAKRLLGDELDAFVGIAMHSSVFYDLQKQDLIDEQTVPSVEVGGLTAPTYTYRGMLVFVDDQLPRVALATSGFAYTSYMFGGGAVRYGVGSPVGFTPFATDTDILADSILMVQRIACAMEPVGVSYTGSIAGAAPTDAELENGANWTKVYNDKNIRIVKVVSALAD